MKFKVSMIYEFSHYCEDTARANKETKSKINTHTFNPISNGFK